MSRYVPISRKSASCRGPLWLDTELRALRKRRKCLCDRFKRTTDPADYEVNITCRNECTKLKRTKRSKYEEGLAESAVFSPKRLFSYLRRRTRVTNGILPLVDPQSHLLMEDDLDKARVLQRQYSSVFPEAVPPMSSDTVATPNKLDNIVFSVSMIEKQLRIMNAQSAPGPEEIHPRVLKHLASVLAASLEIIITKSMETGQLPPAWKSVLVKPMFKGGDRHDLANYRPVILTSVVGKVMERLVKNEIERHFEREGLWAIA